MIFGMSEGRNVSIYVSLLHSLGSRLSALGQQRRWEEVLSTLQVPLSQFRLS